MNHRLFSILCMLFFATTLRGEVIFEANFDSQAVGSYSRADLNTDWDRPRWNNGVDEGRVAIVEGDEAFAGKSLAVAYPADLWGSKLTGAQWQLDFDQPYEAAKVEYRIKFADGFNFVRGGKLPGLAGGTANTGGDKPNGLDGWTARMHWRTDGSSGSRTPQNRANVNQYIYHPDQPTTFGEDFRWDDGGSWAVFDSDRWYHVEHQVEMNTPGENDGRFLAWMDGELVLEVNDLRYRDTADIAIDKFYFSTFFGGSGAQWATAKDDVAFFDDFKITVPTICIEAPQGDLNADGTTSFADFLLVSTEFGQTKLDQFETLSGDTNCDGAVNFADFLVVSSNFGTTNMVEFVPEPDASELLVPLLLCGMWLLRRRRSTGQ